MAGIANNLPLHARAIQSLMNTINMFRNQRELARENAILRQHLSQSHDLLQENLLIGGTSVQGQQSDARNAASSTPTVGNHSRSEQNTKSNEDASQNREKSPETVAVHPKVNGDGQEEAETAVLRDQVSRYRERHAELLENFQMLNAEMKKKKIDSFEMLAEQDKESMKILIELARLTEPMPMQGKNIGLFGLTSTGKSTMLNTLLGGKPVAETGPGETTVEIKRYPAEHYALWDVPGRNDEIAYLSMKYIAFFKGLSRRLVLIQATVKENSSMMKLLDEIGLCYDIVFNKFDNVDEEDRPKVQQQIAKEIKDLDLKGVQGVYFVSAKKPQMFSDWLTMVNHLTD